MSLPPTPRYVAVIDIGKTNAKLALVDLQSRAEIATLRQPNRPSAAGDYPHHDVETLWTFILDSLAVFGREHRIEAISVTTHGATAALVDDEGNLVLPVLDYEHPIPDSIRQRYDAIRPAFDETGSPALPLGLNLGLQLYWLREQFPAQFARARSLLSYPQYWSWRLSGVMASEATSLGCHTDLWNPRAGDFSTLVDNIGLRSLFPPLRPANALLGPVLPEIASHACLAPLTPVVNGIHDSNASLLPHLIDRAPPFAVVSTGTWVVCMAIGGREVALDPSRDTLINVNVFGDAVPSARFMGGREFELLLGDRPRQWKGDHIKAVSEKQVMLLPSVVRDSGPFPRATPRWIGDEPEGGERLVAVSFYLALMTATCLELVGAEGSIVVEGSFSENEPYLAMLEAACGRPVIAQPGGATGTSIGAALLAVPERIPFARETTDRRPFPNSLRSYATEWISKVATIG